MKADTVVCNQVFERNEVEMSENAFLIIFKNSQLINSMCETFQKELELVIKLYTLIKISNLLQSVLYL